MSLLAESPEMTGQIEVPLGLPLILKEFCKSAIRTQPNDLLGWSTAYFQALADGEEPPVKARLEYQPRCSQHGLTLGFLRVIFHQLGGDCDRIVPLELMQRKWDDLCLDERDISVVVLVGRFRRRCQLKRFLVIAAGLIGRNLSETMVLVCELLTREPDGGSAMIPIALFMELYAYLAALRCDGSPKPRGSGLDECLSSQSTPSLDALSLTRHSTPDTSCNKDGEGYRRVSSASGSNKDLGAADLLTAGNWSKPESRFSRSKMDEDDFENLTEEQDSRLDLNLTGSLKGDDEEQSIGFDSFNGGADDGAETPRSKSKSAVLIINGTRSETGSPKTSILDKSRELCEFRTNTNELVSKKAQLISSPSEQPSSSTECSEANNSSRCLPIVPGIGRTLLAEEVTKVAIWMSDCARRQGGMVGPRNIRHIDCPPLEGICLSAELSKPGNDDSARCSCHDDQ